MGGEGAVKTPTLKRRKRRRAKRELRSPRFHPHVFSEIGKVDLLNAKQEAEWAADSAGDQSAKKQLAEANLRLVEYCEKYIGRVCRFWT